MSSQLNRRPWSKEEDEIIRQLVAKLGLKNWSLIATNLTEQLKFNPRTGKQCRERWLNHLDPKVDKQPWSQQEEQILAHWHEIFGNKWSEISKMLPGRTDNTIKNHYYSNLRKTIRQQNKLKKKISRQRQKKKPREVKKESINEQQVKVENTEQAQDQTEISPLQQKQIKKEDATDQEIIKEEVYKKQKPNLQLSNEVYYDNFSLQSCNSSISITPLISPTAIFQFPQTPTSVVFVSPKNATFFTVLESPQDSIKSSSFIFSNYKSPCEGKTFKF